MTRQKKEILRQIDEIERDIEIDQQLAYGMAPPGAYDSMYQQIDELWDKLARLSHYESPEAMFHDERHRPKYREQEDHKPHKKVGRNER